MSKKIELYNSCLGCGAQVKTTPRYNERGKKKCCSVACARKYNWSNPEYRRHMSDIHKGYAPVGSLWLQTPKGKEHSRRLAFKKGTIPWNKGFAHMSGENHPMWIKDRSKLVKSEYKHLDSSYRIWMLSVKNRDGWKCKISNSDCSGRLEAHHILGWKSNPELRYEINNGITLCHHHHPRKRDEEKRLSPYFQSLIEKAN